MKRLTAGILVVILIASLGAVWWYRGYETNVPKKPPLWGLRDPPASNNLTWSNNGNVQIARASMKNAPRFYGQFQEELLRLGYSMMMGNWSTTKCQWSVWNSGIQNRTYYIAYDGEKFLAIRGDYVDVMNATGRYWLCQNPANATPIVTPSPETEAKVVGLQLGNVLMQRNITVGPENWSGPLPDWYLGKFSFKINFGNGVDALVLVYTSTTQAEYAAYQLRKKDPGLEILGDYGGQYSSLLVLKGRSEDVRAIVKIIQSAGNMPVRPDNSTG